MQPNNKPQALEAKILTEISDVESKIRDLIEEKKTLERMLVRIRSERLKGVEAIRRNSVDRILFETKILKIISEKNGLCISTNQIEKELYLLFGDIKKSTLRSYLHRLKMRGEIKNYKNRRGYWVLDSI